MEKKKLERKYVDESDLPTSPKHLDWELELKLIKKGTALVIRPDEYNYRTMRNIVKQFKVRGMFTHLRVTTVTKEGGRWTYIHNPSD